MDIFCRYIIIVCIIQNSTIESIDHGEMPSLAAFHHCLHHIKKVFSKVT